MVPSGSDLKFCMHGNSANGSPFMISQILHSRTIRHWPSMQHIHVTHVDRGVHISWLSLLRSLSAELYEERRYKRMYVCILIDGSDWFGNFGHYKWAVWSSISKKSDILGLKRQPHSQKCQECGDFHSWQMYGNHSTVILCAASGDRWWIVSSDILFVWFSLTSERWTQAAQAVDLVMDFWTWLEPTDIFFYIQ